MRAAAALPLSSSSPSQAQHKEELCKYCSSGKILVLFFAVCYCRPSLLHEQQHGPYRRQEGTRQAGGGRGTSGGGAAEEAATHAILALTFVGPSVRKCPSAEQGGVSVGHLKEGLGSSWRHGFSGQSFIDNNCRGRLWQSAGGSLVMEDAEERPSSRWLPEMGLVRRIEQLGGRVTKSDLVRAGAAVDGLERELLRITKVSGASMQVNAEGEICFNFPAKLTSALRSRSRSFRRRQALAKLSRRSASVGRVLFGFSLFVVLGTILICLIVLASSGSASDDNSGGSSRSGGSGSGSASFDFDWYDIEFLWYDMIYPHRRVARPMGGLSFFEAVSSFVFGAADPNKTLLREKRWDYIATCIDENRGVVVAEQLAPYLDPPKSSSMTSGDATRQGIDPLDDPDEQRMLAEAMLPVLVKFGGKPEVTDDGRIVYVFPDMRGAQASPQSRPVNLVRLLPGHLEEKLLKFSDASDNQVTAILTLASLALLGAGVLGSHVTSPSFRLYAMYVPKYRAIQQLYPFLLGYCLLFLGIPLCRRIRLAVANKRIAMRNAWRRMLADRDSRLQQRDGWLDGLKKKFEGSRVKIFGERAQDVVYDTSKPLSEDRERKALTDFDAMLYA